MGSAAAGGAADEPLKKTLRPQWGGEDGEIKRTFSVVGRVLDDLLVALELGCDDLVPGDPQLVVDVDGMLRLLCLVDLQTAHDKHLVEAELQLFIRGAAS